MDITEYNLTNIITLLDNYERVKLGDITLIKADDKNISVLGWTNYNDIKNVTKDIAKKELEEIKGLYQKLLDTSSDFKKYMLDKSPIFELCYDYGMGGLLVCSIINDKFVWALQADT